ncbi:tetratricopeptide repeat protein [Candidatus Haliotispira prima]|uniref:Tetratricopeptide repeat protein n=1 Tax=Candidatus Haliotispira prima TaxID=3034016 RepID=A0ABY8MM22_9SPIO|nr:tetratricopeptide repeat protein [Candidatus Haliotispira prima]
MLLSPFSVGDIGAQDVASDTGETSAKGDSAQETTDELLPMVAEERSPGWLLLEQGKRLYREGDYGEALRKFLLARGSGTYAPEANYLIGSIFDTDNDLALAVSQMREALDQKDFFYDQNDVYNLYMTLANLYYRQQNYHEYEATMLKVIRMELPATPETLRKGLQIRNMLQKQGIDNVLYYYDDSYSHIIPALNELSLYYYKEAHYNDALRLSLYSVISTLSQGIGYLKQEQYMTLIPQTPDELYTINPEYIIDKLSTDLERVGIDYPFEWDIRDLSLKNPKEQLAGIIAKIREVDPLYQFSLLGYYLNSLEQYPVTWELLDKNQLYRQLYFIGSALSIQGHMDSANNILNVLNYQPQAGEWSFRAGSQLRQSFIDKQIPLGVLSVQITD